MLGKNKPTRKELLLSLEEKEMTLVSLQSRISQLEKTIEELRETVISKDKVNGELSKELEHTKENLSFYSESLEAFEEKLTGVEKMKEDYEKKIYNLEQKLLEQKAKTEKKENYDLLDLMEVREEISGKKIDFSDPESNVYTNEEGSAVSRTLQTPLIDSDSDDSWLLSIGNEI